MIEEITTIFIMGSEAGNISVAQVLLFLLRDIDDTTFPTFNILLLFSLMLIIFNTQLTTADLSRVELKGKADDLVRRSTIHTDRKHLSIVGSIKKTILVLNKCCCY